MAPYFGLSGGKLHAAVWIESWVAVSIFGYNSAGAGGVLNSPAFRLQFPSIDVTDAPESQKHDKSLIQGMPNFSLKTLEAQSLIIVLLNRNGRGFVRSVRCLWGVGMHFLGRLSGSTDDSIYCRRFQPHRRHHYVDVLLSGPVHCWSHFHRNRNRRNYCHHSSMAV